MSSPLISVIIPVYNSKDSLSRCIDSVASQYYENLEVIIVNDGSTDGSSSIIDEYSKIDERIKVIHKDNGGVSSARNCGLEIATGTHITFVDSDDFIEKETYNEVVQVLGSKDFAMFSMKVVNEQGKALSVIGSDDGSTIELLSNETIIKDYLGNLDLSSCNYVFRRDLIANHRFDGDMRRNEDALFVFRLLLEATNGVRINKVFYNYVHNRKSATKSFKRADIDDRKRYIYYVVDSIEQMYPRFASKAKERMLRNQDLVGLLLNSKMVGDKDSVKSTRQVISNYLHDIQDSYSLPKKSSLFIAMTYLPTRLFKITYKLYHTAKEMTK